MFFSVGLFLRDSRMCHSCISLCTIGFSFAARGILHILDFLNLDLAFLTREDTVTTFMFHRPVPWEPNVTQKLSIIPM